MFKSAWDSKQDAVYSTNLQLTKVSVPLISILFLIQERKESETCHLSSFRIASKQFEGFFQFSSV